MTDIISVSVNDYSNVTDISRCYCWLFAVLTMFM